MPEQPNKPGGDFRDDGTARPAEDEQAVKNQATVSPEDYDGDPTRASGEKASGKPPPRDKA